jgi:choline dehydrogenase-like flavoprotein
MTSGARRTGRLYRFADYHHPIRVDCDYVIVGSGPGGGMLAHWLGKTGAKVVLVEAGAPLGPADFVQDVGKTLASHFWEGGARTARGNVVTATLQPRALGGGTVFNSAICMRPLPSALERWQTEFGLTDLTEERLRPHFEAVESFLGIKPADEAVWGRRNELFREACDTLGWRWAPIERFEDGCVGSGECITGCRNERKLSLDRRGIREFVEEGGTVYTSVHVSQVTTDRGAVTGVTGHTVDPKTSVAGQPVRIRAARTILAAGAIATPVILRKSGFTRNAVGDRLLMHPSCYVVGSFDEVVNPWNGATQGIHCLEHLERGIKLESLWATAGTFSRGLPRQPKQFKRWVKRWPQLSVFDGWVSGDASSGRVRTLPGTDKPDVQYDVGAADVRRLQETTALLCDMFRAVGAKEVVHGIRGIPEVLSPEEAVRDIRNGAFDALDFMMASNHVMGGSAMGAKADRAVCDSYGKVYDADNLWICDTGLYPSSPGVNPQLTVMALAHRLAERLTATA